MPGPTLELKRCSDLSLLWKDLRDVDLSETGVPEEEERDTTPVVEEPESEHGGADDNAGSADDKGEEEQGEDESHVVFSTPGEADVDHAPSKDYKVEEPESEVEEPLPDQVMETGKVTFLYK
jgi:hypothetical protein